MIKLNSQQLVSAKEKFEKTFQLLKASVEKTADYDVNKDYSADELEPFDALSDRFIRAVEVAIKFFRTYEYYLQAEQSQTVRDGLHQMEKLGLVSGIDIWLEMRDVSNRIVHDYVPEKIAEMYRLIRREFFQEINQLAEKIHKIDITRRVVTIQHI